MNWRKEIIMQCHCYFPSANKIFEKKKTLLLIILFSYFMDKSGFLNYFIIFYHINQT